MKTNFNDFILNEEIKMSKIAKKLVYNDYIIYIGKNAKMNDILTFDIAKPDDIWLHASGVPGSHVVIKVKNNEEPSKDIIKKAAEMALINSRANGKTKIVWTKRKNVKKYSDHNDGQVNVDYKKSKFITLNKNDYI